MSDFEFIPFLILGFAAVYYVCLVVRQFYARWYCDTQEYYRLSEEENGSVTVTWFNQRPVDIDDRLENKD